MIRRRLIFFCGVSISLGPCGGFDGVLRLFFIIFDSGAMGFSAQSGLLSGRLDTLSGYLLCMIMLVIKVCLIVSRRELATPFDLCCRYSSSLFPC